MARAADANPLTGPQRAAVLMLALGDEPAAKLLSMMHDDEVREVSNAMAQLGPVRAEVVEQLCADFVENLGIAGNLVGSYENTERMLLRAMPRERVATIMEEIRGPAGRTMWDKLGNVHETVLANYLKNEYPQTVAVVLSKIKSDHAARVLNVLPESFAMEVVIRMLRMESVQKDVLDGVEKTLRAEFMSNLARSTRRDAHEMMAEIFNNLDRAAESRFVTGLEERSRESADKIKALMFTFEDLQRLTPAALAGADACDRQGQAAARPQRRLRTAARDVLRKSLGACREDAARRHRRARPHQAARCRRGAGRRRRLGQGTGGVGPDRDRRRWGRGADLLTRKPTWLSFDDIADDHAPKPDTVETASDLDAMLEEARAQGMLEGHARGLAQSAADREDLTRRALDAIAGGMTGAEAGFHRTTERTAEALGAVLLESLSAMLPALCARHGAAEIAALAQAIVPGAAPQAGTSRSRCIRQSWPGSIRHSRKCRQRSGGGCC